MLQNATDLLLLMPQLGEDNSFLNSHCGVTNEWKELQENGVIEYPGMNAQWFCDLCHMNNVPCVLIATHEQKLVHVKTAMHV